MRPPHRARRLHVERLEEREVPATFTVSTLADAGAGSLRQAILDANAAPTDDIIEFTVAGTIQLTSTALPPVTDLVAINGTTAPGFTNQPVVELDYNGRGGLRFAPGAAGSQLLSLGHINAAGTGVLLEGGNILVAGNYIGVGLDGATAAGNSGNGIEIRSSSSRNLIGGTGTNAANVISANGGSGIAIVGASRNRVVANFIGTDVTGTVAIGNARSGVVISQGAIFNTIGGTTPDAVQFSGLPPDGNVISGNGGNGVLITSGSRSNTLSGNFIGTDISGLFDRGNAGNGVAIVNADDNSLIGTFRNIDPFLFYNVVGGNDANGLLVFNSDNTIVHANFFGLGAHNNSKVPNGASGAVIAGNSNNTTFGGVIPLGNVTTGNTLHGVVVQDTASNFLAFNSFSGIAAFSPDTTLGNGGDGFHITSTGLGNRLRTSILSANGDDGIEISGAARGVQVVQCFMGTDTFGNSVMGNGDNGVEIGRRAHDNVIGGRQPDFSISPRNLMSGNVGYGVAVIGAAHDNQINFSYIGTNAMGDINPNFGNGKSGIFLGAHTTGTRIGSRDPNLFTLVSGNGGHGIEIRGSGNSVIGTTIGANAAGVLPLPNQGSGVFIDGTNNVIGSTAANGGNTIVFNPSSGVLVASGNGNSIRGNSIHTNVPLGIELGPTGNRGVATPVLTSAIPQVGNIIRVAGRVTGQAGRVLAIDVFANFDEDPLSATEGRAYLGTVNVQIGANGVGRFVFRGNNPPPGAQTFSATATNAAGSTSKFSVGIVAVGP